LSVAFHPKYTQNKFFFVNYTDKSGNTAIARYHTSAVPNIADKNSRRSILSVPQPFANHNGGQLQFGRDGYLYIGMGDGGSGGDPGNRAQNLQSLLGKMLRIDVNHGLPFTIPRNNPFIKTAAARKEIWAYGLRNPWRFSFDRVTGQLYIADVGQKKWEEINLQAATSKGGENYGWRLMEGNHCHKPATLCVGTRNLKRPIIEYSHDNGDCSVVGGYRYRGNSIPALKGAYVYGDFCTGRI
jgi:glucose/arabinose dehydrogenase